MFVADKVDEFILGLDILRAYNASMDEDAMCYDWAETRCQ
jgi:hypothetical protein